MTSRELLVFLLLACFARAGTVSRLASRGYSVLPEPQQVELSGDDIRFGPEWTVSGDAAQQLREEIESRFGLHAGTRGFAVQLRLKSGSVTPGTAADPDKNAIAAQAYQITIDKASATITANAPAGLFYGGETLVQLLRHRGGALWLPQGRITDWPDLQLRHIYWDDAHHLDRLPELKRAVRQAAFYKINGFVLKLEGHYQFKSAPTLVEPYALSPAEYQELTDYGLRYHVQVIPYLDGPAHIAFILKHPEYAKYRSFPDSNYELCATNPDAVKFLSGMFQDLLDANRGSQYVYLSTDEPYYIGMADNAQCREKGGAGKLLSDFVGQVAAPMHRQGRTVMFWGEYPLKPSDIESLPSYLVNAEVYGPAFDPVFHKHGIRQMIYTSTQAGTARFFPDYFTLPNSRRLHPLASQVDRLADGFNKISFDRSRGETDLIGAVVAGWADMGLHPETFWLGYATITAAGWKPGVPSIPESMAAFYRTFYGDGAAGMDRIYQLMSQQAHFWLDSWEWGPSSRKPLFGNSNSIYHPRHPVRDQTLPLPPDLTQVQSWLQDNARRLQLAADFLADNDELLGRLHEALGNVTFNRYNLEVYISVARLYRQNLEMLMDLGKICSAVQSAQTAESAKKSKETLAAYDRAIALAYRIRRQRDEALRDATETFYKSWFPRVVEANGRKFLHELDDVKDHVPDRTVDMSYLVDRELQLPFGAWIETIRAARNRYAAANQLPEENHPFNWQSTGAGDAAIAEDFSHGMDRWWSEGGERVWVEEGRLNVKADEPKIPGGGVATVWFKQPLPADFQLDLDAHVISSSTDVNNVNLFFSYSDPSGRPLEETAPARRTAGYDLYHSLNGYIITFLNESGRARIRIRRDPGFHLLNETYRGQCAQGVTYHLHVTKNRGEITFSVDGNLLLSANDPNPLGGGMLGLRTYRTWLWWDNLRVVPR